MGSVATCLNSVLQNKLALKLAITEIAYNNNKELLKSIYKTIKDDTPELYKIAIRILKIPSLSAASKRNWSAFSRIYNDRRLQLTNNRLAQQNLNQNNDILLDLIDNDLGEDNEETLMNNNEGIDSEEVDSNKISDEEIDAKSHIVNRK
ncbi:4254_t:CDS:2 [Scutellospora calospora]|uniref:4254_t:CDS:1 n=1 Tax=Scutellospora calospora TaxID=85575 RepID=A0ACA9K5G9_9GLOM|nr:4254_t:CDS:2 [Scutellospora calospora]